MCNIGDEVEFYSYYQKYIGTSSRGKIVGIYQNLYVIKDDRENIVRVDKNNVRFIKIED